MHNHIYEIEICGLKTSILSLETFAATTAAAHPNVGGGNTGASCRFVSFQRHPPSLPPTQNVDSADTRELPACHFGGICAKNANFAKIVNQQLPNKKPPSRMVL